MYIKEQKIISSIEDVSNYIEGYDIYNSTFLSLLYNTTEPKEKYEITVYEFRPDLICKDFYGSESYYGIFLLQTKKLITEFRKGVILELLPKSVVDNIIRRL